MDWFSDFQTVHFFPLFTIILIVLFFLYYFRGIKPKAGTAEWIEIDSAMFNKAFLLPRHNMTKKDILPLALILSVFLFLGIFNLGDTNEVNVLYEADNPRVGVTHNDGLYFDEVHFVRTSVQHLGHMYLATGRTLDVPIALELVEYGVIFEWTHPPLGKDIIAASILTFGMTPFGWRMFGAIFGVLLLAVMYVFIKNMFGKTIIATCGTLLLSFDFMRFVQSRIGTVDIFLIFFILTSFFFMYRYITTDGNAVFRKSLLPLAFSGLFFGLAVSIKWIGLYAGVGLLIIYIIRQVKLFFHYRDNKLKGFGEYFTKTIIFSFLFFVIIPATIYYISYIPYGHSLRMTLADGMLFDSRFFDIFWRNQNSMFSYHAYLEAEHPFTSVWWQWLLNIRPILFVNDHVDGLRATFGSFGNPVIYWAGLIAIITMIVRMFTRAGRRDDKSLFIIIGYFCGLLPWIFIGRILFAYHYFPSSLFLILALCHVLNTILERKKALHKTIVCAFTVYTGLIFLIFLPSLSGMFMPNWYYEYFIRWLPEWPF